MKKAYWAILEGKPKVGKRVSLTKKEVCPSSAGPYVEDISIKTAPIQKIERIAANMMAIHTKDAIYFTYCAEE